MGYDGRISQRIDDLMPQLKQVESGHKERLLFEERQQLRDKLHEFRYNLIDDLPSQRITRDDPNFSKYKCKSTFFTGLMGHLDMALRDNILISPEEIKIAKDYILFVRERTTRQRAIMETMLTDEDRAFIVSPKATTQKITALIHEKLWVPTTRDEINFANKTLDALITALSIRKNMGSTLLDAARAV